MYKILGIVAAVAAIIVLSGVVAAKNISADRGSYMAQADQAMTTDQATANYEQFNVVDDSVGYTHLAPFMDSEANEFMMAATRQGIFMNDTGNTITGVQEVSARLAGNGVGFIHGDLAATFVGTTCTTSPSSGSSGCTS